MASFKHSSAPANWHPQIGERITGQSGRHTITGVVQESQRKPGCPAIANIYGCVLCYVTTDEGRTKGINEIKPTEEALS